MACPRRTAASSASWKTRCPSSPVSESWRACSRLCSWRSALSSESAARLTRCRSSWYSSESTAGDPVTATTPTRRSATSSGKLVQRSSRWSCGGAAEVAGLPCAREDDELAARGRRARRSPPRTLPPRGCRPRAARRRRSRACRRARRSAPAGGGAARADRSCAGAGGRSRSRARCGRRRRAARSPRTPRTARRRGARAASGRASDRRRAVAPRRRDAANRTPATRAAGRPPPLRCRPSGGSSPPRRPAARTAPSAGPRHRRPSARRWSARRPSRG